MTQTTVIRTFSSMEDARKALDIIDTFSGSNGFFQFPDYNKEEGNYRNFAYRGSFNLCFIGDLQVEEMTSLNECIDTNWEFHGEVMEEMREDLSVYESVVIVRIPFRHSAMSEPEAIASGTSAIIDALDGSVFENVLPAPGKEVEILEYEISAPVNTEFEQARKETDSLREDIDHLMHYDHGVLEIVRTDFEIEEVNPADMELIQRVSGRIGFCDSVFIMIDGEVVMNSETIRHIRATVSGMLEEECEEYDTFKNSFSGDDPLGDDPLGDFHGRNK